MSNFYVKNFARKKAIKAIYTGEDKRIKIFWLIPNGDNITIGDNSYKLTPEKVFFNDGIPTVFVNSRDAEPLDPLKNDKVVFSSKDYNTAISSKVGADIFEAGNKTTPKEIVILFGILTILAVGYLIYQFNGMQQLIENFINSQNGVTP